MNTDPTDEIAGSEGKLWQFPLVRQMAAVMEKRQRVLAQHPLDLL